MSVILLAAVLVATVLLVTFCCIRRRNHIRKVQEKVYYDYLREQVILQQSYFAAYSAMLQAAQRQKDDWQF